MPQVLIDTSVWVDHFRQTNAELVTLIEQDMALMHPYVLAELACGTPPEPRRRTLGDLRLLRQARVATQAELLDFIEDHRLYGLRCGMVDLGLLTATLLTPDSRLWTLDRHLAALAGRFGVAHASGASDRPRD